MLIEAHNALFFFFFFFFPSSFQGSNFFTFFFPPRKQEACGIEYTSKLHRMFNDMQTSRDLNAAFRDKFISTGNFDIGGYLPFFSPGFPCYKDPHPFLLLIFF